MEIRHATTVAELQAAQHLYRSAGAADDGRFATPTRGAGAME
ncbi:hypothetical protein ABT025_19315 [Streptomyces sp. NPDC002809]